MSDWIILTITFNYSKHYIKHIWVDIYLIFIKSIMQQKNLNGPKTMIYYYYVHTQIGVETIFTQKLIVNLTNKYKKLASII